MFPTQAEERLWLLEVFGMRILVVEDDIKIASFIIKGLKAAGYAVDHSADGETGLHMALTQPYDTAILTLCCPNGRLSSSKMRKEKIRIIHHLEYWRSLMTELKLQTGSGIISLTIRFLRLLRVQA
jgi:CheY-like chemotaxis protein